MNLIKGFIVILYNICCLVENIVYILGGAAIKKYHVLNDKRHIITKDTESNVAVYDVLKVIKEEDLGNVDFDEEFRKRNQIVYIPNWFTVDLKIGLMEKNIIKYKYKLVYLFLYFPDANNSTRTRRSRLLCCMGISRSWFTRTYRTWIRFKSNLTLR